MAEGILDTEVARKASEQLGDLEYSLPLMQQLENNPLFKVGFDPEHVYYQREKLEKDTGTNNPGRYYAEGVSEKGLENSIERALKDKDPESRFLRLQILREMQKNIGELPEEFLWMEEPAKNLRDKENLATTVHEFVHRSFWQTPELFNFIYRNKITGKERHAVIAYMIGQEFPELKDEEYEKSRELYKIDLTDKETEQQYANIYSDMIKISEDVLDNRLEEGRAKEPVVPIKAEETDKSWFQKLREKIGLKEGGMVDINYLTRRL